MSDLFDALADPTRRDIVTLLRESPNPAGEMSVGELVEKLGITQPTVSKHLKVLRDVGVVVAREEGQHRFYRLDEAPLRQVAAFAGGSSTDSPAASGNGEPFVDLGEFGQAAGGLTRDAIDWLDGMRAKFFR